MIVVVSGSADIARGLQDAGFNVSTDLPLAFDALVHVPDLRAAEPRPFVEIDDEAWDRNGEALLRAALDSCRAAYAAMRERGGRIVLVIPTVALVGAEGRAPFAMACEGMRTMAKAAARQWGSVGITANCVAPSLDVFGIDQDRNGPVAPALGRVPGLDDLVQIIAALLGDAGAVVTGATVPVDGGVVMP